MDSLGEGGREAVDHKGWHMWTGVTGTFYARLLKSSPPVVVEGRTEGERDARIAAYLKDGRKALEKEK
jgi:hypothetical protein